MLLERNTYNLYSFLFVIIKRKVVCILKCLNKWKPLSFYLDFFFQSCHIPQKFRFKTVQNFRLFKNLSPYQNLIFWIPPQCKLKETKKLYLRHFNCSFFLRVAIYCINIFCTIYRNFYEGALNLKKKKLMKTYKKYLKYTKWRIA